MCPPFNIYEKFISFCSVNLPEKYVTLLEDRTPLDIFSGHRVRSEMLSVGELRLLARASCQDSWSVASRVQRAVTSGACEG